jgi:hypothetical protein
MKKALVAIAAIIAPGATGLPAHAGPYIDDLGKCIVDATTFDDRTALIRWMFAAATLHPAVKSLANIPADRLEAESKTTGGLFTRLLTQSCREQTQKAVRYEGPTAIQAAFEVLGRVAGRELFSSPEVASGLSGLDKFVDKDKLKEVMGDAIKDDPSGTPATAPAAEPAPR